MKKLKYLLVVLVILLSGALIVCGAGAFLAKDKYMRNHVFIDGTAYPKSSRQLDLRGKKVTVEEYREIQNMLPLCDIIWDVPFQGGYYDPESTELKISSVSEEDLQMLEYFWNLTTLDARGCKDYDVLRQYQLDHPECRVLYTIPVHGQEVSQDTEELTITGITQEDAQMLPYLPNLRQLNLKDPVAKPEVIAKLREECPLLSVNCEVEVLGRTITSEIRELDLTGVQLKSIDELKGLDYFPTLEKVIVSDCGLDNETLAKARDEKRDIYKLVWTVQCGKLTVRTDDIFFMPVKYNVYYFHDEDAYNLRYCEDMICVDLGHMSIHDIEFVRYMPNLKYLILAHTTVLDITPLESCKNLIFLELDWTGVKDYTPLLGCTSLEDLNLGKTYGDHEPIIQMTWLKNLWWTERNYAFKQEMSEYLPMTHKEFDAKDTVGNGWRKLPNYYDMRDILGMPYM